MRRLAVVAALALLAPSLAAYPLPADGEIPTDARTYLRDRLDRSGCVDFEALGCTPSSTGWAVIGAAATGTDPGTWTPSPVAYLDRTTTQLSEDPAGDAPTDHARTILALLAAGRDPRSTADGDLVAHLRGFHGAVEAGSMGDPDRTHHMFWPALALAGAGLDPDEPILQDLEQEILDAQSANGGWGIQPGGPTDADSTGAALMALGALGRRDGDLPVDRGLDYLAEINQAPDGAFRNGDPPGGASHVQSTALAVQGIVAVGADPTADRFTESGGTPVDYLRSAVRDDGGLGVTADAGSSSPWATAQALPALVARPTPFAAPRAAVTRSPADVSAGTPVEFQADAFDPDGGDVRLTWTARGATGSGPTWNHSFERGGVATVRLVAVDDEGLQRVVETPVDLGNRPPTARLEVATPRPVTGEPVALDWTGSSDPDGRVEAAHLTFGDGNGTGWRTDAPIDHVYEAPGTYEVQATVVDDLGGTAQATLDVTVRNRPPTVSLDLPSTADRTAPVLLVADTADPDGDAVQVTWRIGDRTLPGRTARVAFDEPGVVPVEATARDAHGAKAVAEAKLPILNLPPDPVEVTADPDPSRVGPVTLSAIARDPDGRIEAVTWQLADRTATGRTVEIVLDDSTSLTVAARDDDGATTRRTIEIVPGEPASTIREAGGRTRTLPAAGPVGVAAAIGLAWGWRRWT